MTTHCIEPLQDKGHCKWELGKTRRLYPFIEALKAGEDYLLRRLAVYASGSENKHYGSTKEEEWRMALRESAKAFIGYLENYDDPDPIHVDGSFDKSPGRAFGTIEAKRQRERGVRLDMFLEMMKLIRQSFVDLIYDTHMTDDERRMAIAITCRFFDKFELGFCTEWVRHQENEFARELFEKKRLEAQFFQAQKMEAIGTLAGGIAHDFNNLLMGIQGRNSLMLMDMDSSHPYYDHLTGIEDYVKSASNLTKQLLGFAKGEKYEVKPSDLNEVIRKSSEMFRRTKKEVTIRTGYQKDIWIVNVDQGQMEQVLLNLYVNAWQAMPWGGGLYIQTENVTLDEGDTKPYAVEPGKYVKISVTDTGVGMDMKTQERIFEPFFTTKERGIGTGLGLASVYGIIKNHGGLINVHSAPGLGSTFNVYLPASNSLFCVEEVGMNPIRLHRGEETILLVDDEEIILDVGEGVLKRLGYRVLSARSGMEAITLYREKMDQVHLVILDMIMPEMSGGDVYDRLKDLNPDVRVLLSSGYGLNGQAKRILARGCNGYIQKPFKIKELSHKIRGILDGGVLR